MRRVSRTPDLYQLSPYELSRIATALSSYDAKIRNNWDACFNAFKWHVEAGLAFKTRDCMKRTYHREEAKNIFKYSLKRFLSCFPWRVRVEWEKTLEIMLNKV